MRGFPPPRLPTYFEWFHHCSHSCKQLNVGKKQHKNERTENKHNAFLFSLWKPSCGVIFSKFSHSRTYFSADVSFRVRFTPVETCITVRSLSEIILIFWAAMILWLQDVGVHYYKIFSERIPAQNSSKLNVSRCFRGESVFSLLRLRKTSVWYFGKLKLLSLWIR